MRAGVIRGKGQFELAEVAEPEAGEGQAVIDISRCGICGAYGCVGAIRNARCRNF